MAHKPGEIGDIQEKLKGLQHCCCIFLPDCCTVVGETGK